MAANNYFGFPTSGTQYSSTPGHTNYSAGHTAAGYAVQQTAQAYPTTAATAVAQQRTSQPAYETYQAAAHSTTAYPYATRQEPAYEKTHQSSYYQPQVSYPTTETGPYQNVSNNKPVYSTMNYTARQIATTQKAQPQASQTGSPYLYPSNASSNSTTSNYTSTYNNATPTAATPTYSASAYVQQPSIVTQSIPESQQSQTIQSSSSSVSTPRVYTNNWMSFKKGPVRLTRPKFPSKPQQLHYCEVCKISCAGPQTYKEHLEGQKHKKREAASKSGIGSPFSKCGSTLRCELCDVTCTGSDAYAAHIRGSKHQKVVKLHTKLGKPIPSTEPQVVSIGTTNSKQSDGSKITTVGKSISGATVKKALPFKVKFVPAGTMKLGVNEIKDELVEENVSGDHKVEENEVQPVGQDYIEEIKNDDGKVISFQCKLCECRFNDPNAKEMHMKGRRHRLQYKRKVNPDLVVDIKPSLRQRKIQEDRFRRQQILDELWIRREEERWREEMRIVEEERRRYEEGVEFYDWHRRFGWESRTAPPMLSVRPYLLSMSSTSLGLPFLKRPTTVDDRHVIAKHTQIYPKEEELSAVQKIITNSEKALKQVSDFLTDYDKKDIPKGPATDIPISTEQVKEDKSETENVSRSGQQYRVLKGVMRVGVLAKGLVLTGDLKVQLVVMCAEKPTRTLLERVIDNLPKQLEVVAPEEKYEVKRFIEEAAILVFSTVEPKISVTVTLTSPVMRNTNIEEGSALTESIKDPLDVLDRQKCLEALAALRHAKWFQAKATGLQSCVMVIRILRDLCQRVPTWSHLNDWTMELLVEKVLSSTGQPLSPGDALRRVFEAIASGILLPVNSGLLDPCEKEPVDAITLSNQERDDITASAQHALRLIAFRQIHKVLAMEPLPPPKFTHGLFTRKRRLDNVGEGTDTEGGQNGKKDKKDDVKNESMETVEAKKM